MCGWMETGTGAAAIIATEMVTGPYRRLVVTGRPDTGIRHRVAITGAGAGGTGNQSHKIPVQ